MLVTLAGYDFAKVKLANIRFGTSLLEGGNKLVQASIHRVLQSHFLFYA